MPDFFFIHEVEPRRREVVLLMCFKGGLHFYLHYLYFVVILIHVSRNTCYIQTTEQ